MSTQLGLDRLAAEGCARLQGKRVGLLCHAASVASDLRHITQILSADGINVVRCFGPEHGIWADAQDMISVESSQQHEPVTGAPVVSLYGATEESLAPQASDLGGLDVLLIDLQDIGSRYYTYIYTAALAARSAAQAGVPVLLLDRPNPIGGTQVEGNLTQRDLSSFVGLWPLPTRHGLTIGEVVSLLNDREGFGATIEVLEIIGWSRGQYHDETGLPWVQPSPNMPTLDTAIVYPGMCLLEGTNLSEGRGSTRPFELFGADFIDPFRLADALNERDLPGIGFRPVYFRPTFHKFGGTSIGGLGLHVTDRMAFQPLRCGLHILDVVRRLFGDAMQWRTEVYEFVGDRLAIDLLHGTTEGREIIDSGGDIDALWTRWQGDSETFSAQRAHWLRY